MHFKLEFAAINEAKGEPIQRFIMVDCLSEYPEIRRALAQKFGELGIRGPVKFVGAGSYAITFETSNRQLVRISDEKTEGERLFHLPPTVLKPLKTYKLDEYDPMLKDIRIDIMPLVAVGEEAKITKEEMDRLVRDTAGYKYIFWDVDESNTGRLQDGTPIIIDLGAVAHCSPEADMLRLLMENLPNNRLLEFLGGTIDDFIDKMQTYMYAGRPLCTPYEISQMEHLDALNLEPDRLAGTITAEDIRRYREVLGANGKDSRITDAMLQGRHDQASWEKSMDSGLDIARRGDGDAWLEYIAEQSKERGSDKSR